MYLMKDCLNLNLKKKKFMKTNKEKRKWFITKEKRILQQYKSLLKKLDKK